MSESLDLAKYEDDINLIFYWRLLVKYKIFILISLFLTLGISSYVAINLPNTYMATGSLTRHKINNFKDDMNIVLEILKSQTLMDNVLKNLKSSVIINSNMKQKEISLNRTNIKFRKTNTNIIKITAFYNDPEISYRIVDTYINELEKLGQKYIYAPGKREYIEDYLSEYMKKQKYTEKIIRKFTDYDTEKYFYYYYKTKLTDYDYLFIQNVVNDVVLEAYFRNAADEMINANLLRKDLMEIKKILSNIKNKNSSVSTKLFMNENNNEEIKYMDEYIILIKEEKINEFVIDLLSELNDYLIKNEPGDKRIFQILDGPKIPLKKSKPNRITIVSMSMIISLIFIIFFLLVLEQIKVSFNKSKENM